MAGPLQVTLSLISHTNVGKTTLARTLLRRDIGEVRDQAHVTEVSEAHTLIETPAARLALWDTPGFGDTTRLMRRLRGQANPVGWFLHQVWDRLLDRPLWCSQEAVRNIQEEADVVLYLVNASEDPGGAGYVPQELELLGWIGRPVMILLNQVGEPADDALGRWREATERFDVVRDWLALDAFTRAWVEEVVLLHRVAALLEGDRQQAMAGLAAAWQRRNVAVFEAASKDIADYLLRAATDAEAADSEGPGSPSASLLDSILRAAKVPQKRAMEALGARLDGATSTLMQRLIAAHGLEGESAARIAHELRDFKVPARFDERSAGLASAVVGGLLSGLAADALSGGLSLGGGAIAGGILGLLGGTALAKGYRLISGDDPEVRWSPEFLELLFRQTLLWYLSVAHFGRGQGVYRDLQQPQHWEEAVRTATAERRDSLTRVWRRVGDAHEVAAEPRKALAHLVSTTARKILKDAYPHAAPYLD